VYCNHCKKETPTNANYCLGCGSPFSETPKTDSAPKPQSTFDAIEDIQKKLQEIDNRKRPSAKNNGSVKSAFESLKQTIRDEAVSSGLTLFNDRFEEEKLADKKKLIQNYPLPSSPQALEHLAKYIISEIDAKKKNPDALTPIWKEKFEQVYKHAKTYFSDTKEFSEIQKYENANERRKRHASIREYIVLSAFAVIPAFILSLIYHWPLLLFASILAAGWEIFLILYVYDLLDNIIASIKQHSETQQYIPKILRTIAWHLLVPLLAALITSIAYHSVIWITLSAILFGVDVLFLLIFLSYIYELK